MCAFVFDWFDVCIMLTFSIPSACWNGLFVPLDSLAHTQPHLSCKSIPAAPRSGEEKRAVGHQWSSSQRTSGEAVPKQPLLSISERRAGEKWCMLLHIWSLATDRVRALGGEGEGGVKKKKLKKGLEKTFPSWGLNKRDWTRRKSSYARRGSAARSAGDGWRRAAVTEISIFVIYHFLLRYSGFCQFKKRRGWFIHLLRGNSTSHQFISDHFTIILE